MCNHATEQPYNPATEASDEEKRYACRWELLRRCLQFRAVAKKWVATDSFRKAHALTPDYNDVLVERCALDWMLTPEQRLDLARFQIEELRWKRHPHPNFGPITYRQKSLVGMSRKNAADLLKLRPLQNAPKPVTPNEAWDKVSESFKRDFRLAVRPALLKSAFAPINSIIADASRLVRVIGRKLALGDPFHEMNGMAEALEEIGEKLHDLASLHQLYRLVRGPYSSKTFKGFLAQIEKDFSGPHGEIFDGRKYDRHRSYLGTVEDWRWFLEAERLGLGIRKSADLRTLSELYSEDLRQRKMRGKAPPRAKVHGHTGSKFSGKVIKNRRIVVKRHVRTIEKWILLAYLRLTVEPGAIAS